MSKVTVQTKIEAAPEQVYDVMLDPARLEEWVTIHRKVCHADDGPLREGYSMVQQLALRGAPFKVSWTLTEYDRPRTATWEGRGPGGSYARTTYRLATDGGSGTRFEYENEYEAPGGFLGAAASRALVGATSRREAEKSLQRLKRMLER